MGSVEVITTEASLWLLASIEASLVTTFGLLLLNIDRRHSLNLSFLASCLSTANMSCLAHLPYSLYSPRPTVNSLVSVPSLQPQPQPSPLAVSFRTTHLPFSPFLSLFLSFSFLPEPFGHHTLYALLFASLPPCLPAAQYYPASSHLILILYLHLHNELLTRFPPLLPGAPPRRRRRRRNEVLGRRIVP